MMVHLPFNQDVETGCPKLAIVKFLGVHFFNASHNEENRDTEIIILRFLTLAMNAKANFVQSRETQRFLKNV